MARSRLDLHAVLAAIPGVAKAYFQPPTNDKMEYPCVLYRLNDIQVAFAGNSPYRNTKQYQVTVIDRDPDSLIPAVIAAMPLCRFDRFFTADGYNHTVYNLFF